jgi:hypothetical protein
MGHAGLGDRLESGLSSFLFFSSRRLEGMNREAFGMAGPGHREQNQRRVPDSSNPMRRPDIGMAERAGRDCRIMPTPTRFTLRQPTIL